MKYIYAAATKVVIWLGERDEVTGGKSTSIAGRAIALLQSWALRSQLELTNSPPISADFFADTDDARANITCLQSLLGRPWWSRTWVLQELYLAREVPWTTFDRACYAIARFVHLDDLLDSEHATSMRFYYDLFQPSNGKRRKHRTNVNFSTSCSKRIAKVPPTPAILINLKLPNVWDNGSPPMSSSLRDMRLKDFLCLRGTLRAIRCCRVLFQVFDILDPFCNQPSVIALIIRYEQLSPTPPAFPVMGQA